MTSLLGSLLALALLVSATGWEVLAADAEISPEIAARDPLYVDATDLLYLESYPIQVYLLVQGSLPTPCHEPVWEVRELEDRIDVRLWSEAAPGRLCMAVLEPVDISVPLGAHASASLPVTLNGSEVGRIEIEGEAVPAETALTGAGWSFGMCLGYCRADLQIAGPQLVLTGREHMSEEPLFVNTGTLTVLGLDRLDAALASLSVDELQPLYGCPDCADGGAAYLGFSQDGRSSRHDVEFGGPPEELAEAYDLAMDLMAALETCVSNDLVDVATDCQAQER